MTRRHGSRGRITVLAAALLAALLCAGRVDAAQLSLGPVLRPYTGVLLRPCNGSASAAPSGAVKSNRYGEIVVSVPQCSSGTGYVELRTSKGALIASGTGTVSSAGVFRVTVNPAFNGPSTGNAVVFVSVGSWPMTAAWSSTPV